MLTKAWILAIILTESGGNPIAQSPMRAEGLMQLTSIGIQEVRDQYNITGDLNVFNPTENIKYGVLLLEFYARRAGSTTATLVAFNSGYAGLARYRQGGLAALSQETREYVGKVLGRARTLDPMFARELPGRSSPEYLRSAIDSVFEDVYGVGPECETVIFGAGLYTL